MWYAKTTPSPPGMEEGVGGGIRNRGRGKILGIFLSTKTTNIILAVSYYFPAKKRGEIGTVLTVSKMTGKTIYRSIGMEIH